MTVSSAPVPATDAAIAQAVERLRSGELVAFPTETVYGLGADATDDSAVARIFAAKRRPRFHPLIVHVSDLDDVLPFAVPDGRARALATAFWPGPLTLVLPRVESAPVALLASAGLPTVAVRAPAHPVARMLLAHVARPLAAPSANPFGGISPTTAVHVLEGLGDRVAMILDGGPCRVGVESTIVDLTRPEACILRPGGIPERDVAVVIGPLAPVAAGAARAPGTLTRHYAPARPLRLNALTAEPGEVLLGFGPQAPEDGLNLSPCGDLEEASANLFAMLRALDRADVAAIAVMPVPEDGLGVAINDRLRRAAAPAPSADDWGDDRGPAAPCVLPDQDWEP